MKSEKKKEAFLLRKKGFSINKIARELNVSKGSVSVWVRNVTISKNKKASLKKNSHKKGVIEKRRRTRLLNEEEKRNTFSRKHEKEILSLSKEDIKIIGAMLYWAEGRKRGMRIVSFSNSDPDMIKLMMIFFKDICKVPKEKFRGHIHLHSHLDRNDALKYWAKVSGIPKNQFYKTYCKPSKASKNKRDSLPYGTLDICICDVHQYLKIMGWIDGVKNQFL